MARLSAYAHCLGGGMLSAAISNGDLEFAKLGSVVLSALGLFYASRWDGCVKVQDYIIEQVLAERPAKPTVDVSWPRPSFPPPMDASYARWPKTLQVGCGVEVCDQLSFMFGHPYIEDNLVPGLHDNARLEHLFNHMHLQLYVQCGQNLRRGVYARFDQPEYIARLPLDQKPQIKHFAMPVTLITGEDNALWHRESMDRMYEWMRSNRKRDCTKHVLPGFAHQDLLWGTRSEKEVYPLILKGLLA